MANRTPVLVTTSHRGVFFGYADPDTLDQKTIRLDKCRNCIKWHASIGGFLGLAKVGPNSQCMIGAEAPTILLHDITSVSEVSPEAADAWSKA